MYFHWKTFTATATGRRVEAVTCGQCGCAFRYELVRTGEGRAAALYGLFQGAAQRRADRAAERDLAKRLAREAEMVPCPDCRWVNRDLIERYRRRRYGVGAMWILLVMILCGVGGPLVMALAREQLGIRSETPRTVALWMLCAGVLAPVVVSLVQGVLRRRIDPNRTYPRAPVVPPGTPPALVDRVDEQTGWSVLETVPSVADAGGSGEWAVYRMGQVTFPATCCVCLAPKQTVYGSPLQLNSWDAVPVPLCRACARRLRWRWWGVALGVAAVMTGAAYVAAISIHGLDSMGRWMTGGLLAFFGTIVGWAVVPNWACRPYRVKMIDADRRILRFAARNPGFTAKLVEQVRREEGVG